MHRNSRTQRSFSARWSPFAFLAIPAGLAVIVLLVRLLSAKPAAKSVPVARVEAVAPVASHVATPRRRRQRSRARISPLGLAGSTLGLLVVISMAVLGSGGTFAYLNSATTVGSAAVKSGNAALTSSGSPLSITGLYPGRQVSAAFTVTNTGTIPLALKVSSLGAPTSNVVSQNLLVEVDVVSSAAACTSGSGVPATSAWSGTFASSSSGLLGSTLAAGSSATLCLSATLATSAPSSAQGASTNSFSVTIGGNQS